MARTISRAPGVRRALFAFALGMLSWTGSALASPEAASPEATAPEPVSSQTAEPGLREELRTLVANARDRVFPALVSLQVVTVDYREGQERKSRVTGSGTLVSTDGHVITNEHVTRSGQRFEAILSDQRRVPAELVGADPLTDLALLRIDPAALDEPLPPPAELGDSSALEIGDVVLAMGSPFSLARSVSLGIVSNTERVFAGGFGSDDVEGLAIGGGRRTGLFTRWIQHDAVIAPGNSGGPLVDLAGRIVGVNELGGGALSFAIPSDLVRRVFDELRVAGEVERSWIGLTLRSIEDTSHEAGVLVGAVVEGAPAARGGVEAGDVIVAIDGEPVTARFAEEVPGLLERLASASVGSTITLDLARRTTEAQKTETRSVEVVTERLDDRMGTERAFPAWGFTAREITPRAARDRRLDDRAGVFVTGVRRGGPAQQAEPPLVGGDVLRSLGGMPIHGLDDLVAAYAELAAPDAEPAPFLVVLDREGRSLVSRVEPRRDAATDPPRELPKSWIGVATQPVLASLADELDLGGERGFRVTRVYPGTEAETAGLAVGDVITTVAGESVAPSGLQDVSLLSRRVRGLPIGETVELGLVRDGETLALPVTLERTRLTPEEARRHEDPDFEITVRELTFFDRDARRLDPDVRGVLVENVERAGWAGLGGLRPGDLITEIDGREVRGLRGFRAALDAVRSEQPERVVFVVLRDIRVHYRELEPEWGPTAPVESSVSEIE